jgi:acyl-coenzyme A synthetase/AMP-(fatty) acid ligase
VAWLDASADVDNFELTVWWRRRLAAYECPTSVDRIAAIPRNPSGKILETELRKPFGEGRDRMVSGVPVAAPNQLNSDC